MASAGMPRTTSSLARLAGLCAGAGKDQRALDRFDLEETRESVGLVRFMDKIVALFSGGQGERVSFNV